MKQDLIIPGVEYVVAVKPQHVLIPGTEITYKERLDSFASLDLNTLPKAAVLEHRRLKGAIDGGGLESRLSRCLGLYPADLTFGALRKGHQIRYAGYFMGMVSDFDDRIGTIVTAVEKLPKQRVRIEADYCEEPSGSGEMVAPYFEPSIPELAPFEDDSDQEAIDAWWEENHNGLRDPGGTLTAIVHQAAFKYLYTDDLLARLDEEQEERVRATRARDAERFRAITERRAAQITGREIDEITREAARPSDDEWEAIA